MRQSTTATSATRHVLAETRRISPRLITLARERASVRGEPYMVCLTDDGDSTSQHVYRLSYAGCNEFVAFDGEILLIAYPDGTYE